MHITTPWNEILIEIMDLENINSFLLNYWYFQSQEIGKKIIYIYIYIWKMLTSAFKALVKNPIKESFNITFMRNKKNC